MPNYETEERYEEIKETLIENFWEMAPLETITDENEQLDQMIESLDEYFAESDDEDLLGDFDKVMKDFKLFLETK